MYPKFHIPWKSMNVTFENGVFADVIKMKSYWINMGPKSKGKKQDILLEKLIAFIAGSESCFNVNDVFHMLTLKVLSRSQYYIILKCVGFIG